MEFDATFVFAEQGEWVLNINCNLADQYVYACRFIWRNAMHWTVHSR